MLDIMPLVISPASLETPPPPLQAGTVGAPTVGAPAASMLPGHSPAHAAALAAAAADAFVYPGSNQLTGDATGGPVATAPSPPGGGVTYADQQPTAQPEPAAHQNLHAAAAAGAAPVHVMHASASPPNVAALPPAAEASGMVPARPPAHMHAPHASPQMQLNKNSPYMAVLHSYPPPMPISTDNYMSGSHSLSSATYTTSATTYTTSATHTAGDYSSSLLQSPAHVQPQHHALHPASLASLMSQPHATSATVAAAAAAAVSVAAASSSASAAREHLQRLADVTSQSSQQQPYSSSVAATPVTSPAVLTHLSDPNLMPPSQRMPPPVVPTAQPMHGPHASVALPVEHLTFSTSVPVKLAHEANCCSQENLPEPSSSSSTATATDQQLQRVRSRSLMPGASVATSGAPVATSATVSTSSQQAPQPQLPWSPVAITSDHPIAKELSNVIRSRSRRSRSELTQKQTQVSKIDSLVAARIETFRPVKPTEAQNPSYPRLTPQSVPTGHSTAGSAGTARSIQHALRVQPSSYSGPQMQQRPHMHVQHAHREEASPQRMHHTVAMHAREASTVIRGGMQIPERAAHAVASDSSNKEASDSLSLSPVAGAVGVGATKPHARSAQQAQMQARDRTKQRAGRGTRSRDSGNSFGLCVGIPAMDHGAASTQGSSSFIQQTPVQVWDF